MKNKKNLFNTILFLCLTLIGVIIIVFIYGFFVGKIIFHSFTNDGRESFLAAITVISIVSTTILSILLYGANLKANSINERILNMTKQQNEEDNKINEKMLKITKQQNDIQNILMMNNKKGELSRNIKNIEEYIKYVRVLDLFCYTNFSTYDQLLTLRKHKVLKMPTELNQFINLNYITIPNLNNKEENLLRLNLHNPKKQTYININIQFYNLLPNSVYYQYNIPYLKEIVEKLGGIIDDKFISEYQEGIHVQKQIDSLKLNFFNELLNISDNYQFYNTNYDYTKAKVMSRILEAIKKKLNLMIEEIEEEYNILENNLFTE
ncbi:hypothetical protein M3C31_01205 [Staphylococcus hominis]|uniref:hypothetical protein n=1 Tax=Staphylococcus hominis TaxID=1290 RepID=UPI0021A52BC6|nr:hypothetical protein [Staphylococcus hominis]MCT1482467.1 hypothetical protein [Staphylococcus hominis]